MTTTSPAEAVRILGKFGRALIGLGCVFFLAYAWLLYSSWNSSGWKATDGIVFGHRITWITPSVQPGRTSTQREYSYEVHYRYSVDEVKLSGSRYAIGQATPSGIYSTREEASDEALDRFPPGSEVTVYYKPSDPSDAVLLTGVNSVTHIPLYIGLFLLASGILFINVKPEQAESSDN